MFFFQHAISELFCSFSACYIVDFYVILEIFVLFQHAISEIFGFFFSTLYQRFLFFFQHSISEIFGFFQSSDHTGDTDMNALAMEKLSGVVKYSKDMLLYAMQQQSVSIPAHTVVGKYPCPPPPTQQSVRIPAHTAVGKYPRPLPPTQQSVSNPPPTHTHTHSYMPCNSSR